MSASPSSAAGDPGAATSSKTPHRPHVRIAIVALVVAAVAGVAVGAALALIGRHHAPAQPAAALTPAKPLTAAATWPAGSRPAPDFRLADQHGTPFSLHGLRGRPVLVTFIDPLCRTLCPLEAKTLERAARQLSPAARPAIVAVSVNPLGDHASAFRDDAARWGLGPEWRWGVGTHSALARVWHAYGIAVQVMTQKVAGVTVHDVAHTEAAYLVDAAGDERALFAYPFTAANVVAAVRQLERST